MNFTVSSWSYHAPYSHSWIKTRPVTKATKRNVLQRKHATNFPVLHIISMSMAFRSHVCLVSSVWSDLVHLPTLEIWHNVWFDWPLQRLIGVWKGKDPFEHPCFLSSVMPSFPACKQGQTDVSLWSGERKILFRDRGFWERNRVGRKACEKDRWK